MEKKKKKKKKKKKPTTATTIKAVEAEAMMALRFVGFFYASTLKESELPGGAGLLHAILFHFLKKKKNK